MPVYEGDLDRIVGIVNTKDLFYLFSLRGFVVLEDALYPALFLKPDENVATALKLFKTSKRPMALVRDEDGHILGLITLEDILEDLQRPRSLQRPNHDFADDPRPLAGRAS